MTFHDLPRQVLEKLTFHAGKPREAEEPREKQVFFAFQSPVVGSEAVSEFWNMELKQATLHLGAPSEGEKPKMSGTQPAKRAR